MVSNLKGGNQVLNLKKKQVLAALNQAAAEPGEKVTVPGRVAGGDEHKAGGDSALLHPQHLQLCQKPMQQWLVHAGAQHLALDAPGPQPDPDGGDAPGHEPGGSPQDEFDFSILFDYDYLNPIPEEPNAHKVVSPHSGIYPDDVPDYGPKPYSPLASFPGEPPGRFAEPDRVGPPNFLSPAKPAGASGLSPRIEITPSHELMQAGGSLRARDCALLVEPPAAGPRFTLPVPGFEGYREPLCLSPASSGSSASFISDTFSPYTSPCVSPNNGAPDDLCPQFQNIPAHYSPRTSPIMSPRTSLADDSCQGRHSPVPRPASRSSSPGAKRRHSCAEAPVAPRPAASPQREPGSRVVRPRGCG
uniref:nuclear factor of activated T-cells, cytoplasmic 2-like n=1 Tax=Ictidomys tridecemlineatus TaxID=43179 RepID=UPI001A9E531A|nr:nuclear factor of activated T-cells, cytoplasmic 2-like [Ictidomys tridecemlineatus]